MVAIPDTVTVANQAHSQRFVPSGFMASSITVLNPNDGIVYVSRDRDCLGITVGAWDWKVPSQSYAHLPGPFRSVGLFYVDRSGASLPGEISTYATDVQVSIPSFFAIGRAQVSIVTTLDIGEGSQPAPPASGYARLWVDSTGNLHILDSTNNDVKAIDTNDVLGGALIGTLPNPGLHDPLTLTSAQLGSNGIDIQSSNALIAGNGYLFIGSQKDFYLQRDSASTGHVNGNLSITGQLNPSGGVAAGSIPGNALVNGSVGTTQLAANAAQGPLASYMASPTWSTTTTGSWVGTPLIVNFTPTVSNSWEQMDWAISLRHSVANAYVSVALGWSGAAQAMVNQLQLPAANLPITAAGTYYYQFPTGTPVSLQVYISLNTPGTLTIDTGMQSRLYATEIKR